MKKKVLSLVLSVAMIATLVVGCGNKTTTATTDSKDTATTDAAATDATSSTEKQKITITYNDSGDTGEEGYMYNWIMQTYNSWDKKDQVEIDLQPVVANDSDYFTKIQTEMQDPSTSPDLFFEDTFQLNTDVAAGYVADLTTLTTGWDEWNTTFVESLKEGVKGSDGNTYAVPVSTDVRGLWYNRDVFEQAGLGREWQPKTWQDILDACAAIKEKCADDVVPIWFAASNTEAEATSMNTFEMLLYGTGETLVDESTGVWNITGKGVNDALTFIETCKNENYMGTPSEVFDASDWQYANQYMSTGKLGIYLNGSWGYADYKESGSYPMANYTDATLTEGLGYAQMPKQNGDGYVTMSGGWSWAVAKNSDNQDLAFEFLQQLMKSDNYITYLVGSGNLAVKNDMNTYDDYKSKLYVNEATAMAETAYFRPHNENYSKVSSYIYEAVDSIVRNGTSIKDAMASMKTSVETVVGADKTK